MLRLHQLLIGLDEARDVNEAFLRRLCAQRLKIKESRIARVRLSKRSVDARGREGVRFALTADVLLSDAEGEARIAQKFKPNQVTYVPARTLEETADVFGLNDKILEIENFFLHFTPNLW